jgi:serine/threonine protein kinase
VHRDVKPSNALMTGDEHVYLIDFGIAHDDSVTKLTQTGSVIGTFAYMAPERFLTGTADARADVYALACVLHECLTGSQPFPGNSMEQQIAGHLSLDPPKPTSLKPDIPAGFDEVIARSMAKKPEERYQTATELAAAARHALTTEAPDRAAPTVTDTTPPPAEPAMPAEPAIPAEPTVTASHLPAARATTPEPAHPQTTQPGPGVGATQVPNAQTLAATDALRGRSTRLRRAHAFAAVRAPESSRSPRRSWSSPPQRRSPGTS